MKASLTGLCRKDQRRKPRRCIGLGKGPQSTQPLHLKNTICDSLATSRPSLSSCFTVPSSSDLLRNSIIAYTNFCWDIDADEEAMSRTVARQTGCRSEPITSTSTEHPKCFSAESLESLLKTRSCPRSLDTFTSVVSYKNTSRRMALTH